MEEQRSSSEILLKEIREQSKAEAEAIIEQAEKESNRILKEAKVEAEKIRSEILHKAEVQASRIRKKILSGVHLEVKKQTLYAREEIMSRIFEKVEEKLEKFRLTKTYLPFLKKLIIEGVLALELNATKVIAGNVEKKILDRKFLSKIEREIREHEGKNVKLSLLNETLTESGVILVSSDGRMRFDNRLSTRMHRIENEMRLMVVKKVVE